MAEVLSIQSEFSEQELLEQKRYDLKTRFAELVDGSMTTDFELHFNGHDLIGEDGRSLDKTTQDGLDYAKKIAKANPNLWFGVRRSSIEREEFHKAVKMGRGEGPNTMIVPSDSPGELWDATEDVGGYNVTRKQTMLRIIIRKPDGNLRMYSQSLDGSNRQALEAIYARFGLMPEPGELLGQRINIDLPWEHQQTLVNELTGIYDRSLADQFGGEWRAGRRPADYRNTYDFVCRQQDIIEECLRLDKLGWLNEDVMYKMSATMNKRFEAELKQVNSHETLVRGAINQDVLRYALYKEVEAAGSEARALGTTFSACGVTLGAESNQFEQAGYGSKTREELSWHGGKIKKGKCVNCKKHTDVGVENWCQKCIKC